jgi:hypothetical protein
MPKPSKKRRSKSRTSIIIIGVIAIAAIVIIAGFLLDQRSTSVTTSQSNKLIILYVNQGNALVSTSNFTSLLNFAKAQGFNTIFFQVYRGGNLIFSQSNLSYFVETAHLEKLKIFFALYFTGENQLIPTLIYNLGEDGINLDMSTLSSTAQTNLLETLQQNYRGGQTSVTATNFTTTLRPNLLILETYQVQNSSKDSYIHPGIIASVEPLSMSSEKIYQSQYQYDLSISDGVMVFDYYGLLKTGYQT